MKAVAPRRPGGTNPIMMVGAVVSGLVLVALLWYSGVLDLSFFRSKEDPTIGLIAIPTPARVIPAYTRITRDHLWDPTKNQLAVVYLPPSAVTKEMLRLPDIIGRVLNHEKTPGYVFTDSDFMPPGTREGFIAGVPAGKRALRIPADSVEGLYGLHQGDRFDLIASMPIEAAQEGATGGENLSFGGVYGQQMALEAQLSNWQKQATVHVIVQNGTIVEPLSTRQIAQLPGGDPTRARIRPVQEAVVAISPEEVARLTEAMTVQARPLFDFLGRASADIRSMPSRTAAQSAARRAARTRQASSSSPSCAGSACAYHRFASGRWRRAPS